VARTNPVKQARRSLIWLAVIILGLAGLNLLGALTTGAGWAPKLALDLEGGTQIILAPKIEGGKAPTQEQLDQAVSIIRLRVDAGGISEAEITTQGGRNVVVSLPGTPDDATKERIEAASKLEFRPVLVADLPSNTSITSPSPSPSEPLESTPSVSPSNASDEAWVTPALQAEFDSFNCASLATSDTNAAPADKPLITCEDDGSVKYILGPVEVSGEHIADASNGMITTSQGANTGKWAVNIVFDGTGTKQFAEVTERLYNLTGVQNQFAIVLDGRVISAPTTNAIITDGKPQITGNFTQQTSKTLADQLKFGALPIGFQVQSSDTISATLGTSFLISGLIAGLIGMALVVVYSLLQYRVLGFVTVFSLVVAALITYMVVLFLSWREGYRLSLAGVAGLIVAIGITADSFIVYFERIRDELRDGRVLESAVDAGWKRAFRTVLASDTVNFLAACILFIVAVGNVKGFALTLGITTIIDVVVVSLFTHPMLQLLSQTRFFGGGHPLSGLNPQALGAVYRGRAQFRAPVAVTAAKRASSGREAARRQTIAERKAAEAASQRQDGKDS